MGHRHVEFTWVKAHRGILLNECADQLATRGVVGSSYDEKIPVIPAPEDDPESAEEFEIGDDQATQSKDFADTNQRPLDGFVAQSVGLAEDEERGNQEEMLRRFKPSPVSATLKRAMEQPKQLEIVYVADESESESPKVSFGKLRQRATW
jgi:hypothetical protein